MSTAPETNTALFAGKYRLIKVLGKGAMGEVWLAEEEGPRGFRRRVAVKRLLTATDIGDYATESFIAEAQVIAKLDHPNVVRLIELGASDGGLYLVLDYVDGPALDRMIKKGGGPLSAKAVAYMGREMARALEAVHTMSDDDGKNYGVVHRDVSPSNILISRDGRVRLSDFGVARISGLGGDKTETGVFKGKLPYMPPEQARGDPFDGRADLFSLGITLFEAAMGGRLRRAETQGQLITMVATERIPPLLQRVPNAPPALAAAIDRATEFDASRRIADAGELASMLDEALRSFGPRADKEGREELRERVAKLIGVAAPVVSSMAPSHHPSIRSANAPSAGDAIEDPPTVRPAEWSVALGPPGSEGQPSDSDPHDPAYSSEPSVQSAVRSTANAVSGENTDGVRTVAHMTQPHATTQPSTPAHRRRSNGLLAVAAIGLVAVAVLAVLVLQHLLAATASAARASSATTAASTPTETAPPQASANPASGVTSVTSATAVTSATGDGTASKIDPLASATANPSHGPDKGTSRVPGGAPPPRVTATADDSASTDPGTLQVVVLPWADVIVDGRSVGTTPIAPVSLPAGSHSVVLRNSELGASRSQGVVIKPGKSTLLRVDLRRTE